LLTHYDRKLLVYILKLRSTR